VSSFLTSLCPRVLAAGALLLCLPSVMRTAAELPKSGETVTRELAGAGVDQIEVSAHAGDYAEISVVPRGTLLSVKADRVVVGARSGARVYIPMRSCWITGAGPLRIYVESQEVRGANRRYGIAVIARPGASGDADRVSACRELHGGEESLVSGTAGLLAAMQHFRSSLSHWEAAGDLRPQAEILLQIGITAENLGQKDDAVAAYKRSAEIYRGLQDRPNLALALQYLGTRYEVAGDVGNANAAYEESLKLSREANDRVGEANAMLNPAFSAARKKGPAPLEQVLAIYREQGHRLGEAMTLNLLGNLHHTLGEPEAALRCFDEALRLDRVLHNRQGEGQVLNNKATILSELGEITHSVQLRQQALGIRQQWGSVADVLITRYSIAMDYLNLGEYDKALELLEQARAGARSAGHRQAEAFALQGAGQVYKALGESDQAAPRFEEAAALFRQLRDTRGEAISLTGLGRSQQMQGDWKKAQTSLEESLRLAREASLRPEVSSASAALGQLLSLTGDHKRAWPLLEDALSAARVTGNSRGVTVALEALGDASLKSGQVEDARTFFREALTEAAAIRSPREQGISGIGLARSEMAAGRIAEATIHVRAALQAFESVRAGISSPDLRASYLSTAGDDYRTGVEILMALDGEKPNSGFAEEAFTVGEQGRARSLLDVLSAVRVQVRPDAGADLRASESSARALLNDKAESLIRLLSRKHTDPQAAGAEMDVRQAEDSYKQAQQRVWRASPRYAELMTASPARIADVQRGLPEGTVLLEYSLGETASVVWIVTRSNVQAQRLAPRKEIEQLALAFGNALTEPGRMLQGETLTAQRERLQHASTEFRRTAAELSRRILPASLAALKASRIWVVPDGALQYIPFAALPHQGGPLVESVEVTTLPSASALLYLGSRVRTPIENVAVFADPVFSSNDARVQGGVSATPAGPSGFAPRAADFDLDSLHRLRFSRQEAEEIAAVSGRTRVRIELDFAANRDNALNVATSQAGVLHFATHALLDEKRPELSGIVLSMVGPDGRPRNGFLRLDDIYQWKIRAQLVVLSACRTALGKRLENEGQIGLVRGFFYAGASDVLATLWSVDDRATAVFIGKFYEGLLRDRLSPAAALRRAQNEIRKDSRWSDPFYWSAFALIGA
jgi:CHAT domain-containing protein